MRNDPISDDDHDFPVSGDDNPIEDESGLDDPPWADAPEIVTCSHCGAETDDESILCPICQRRIQARQPVGRSFVLAIVLILIVLFLWPFLGWMFQPK